MHALSLLSLAQVAADHESDLARDLLAILAAAGLVALLLRRFNVATIPGYLVAGAVIGPHALGLATGEGTEIGHLATVMLMFIIGLHLDMSVLRAGWISSALVGIYAAVLTVLVGTGLGMLLGLSTPAAVAIAMALSISSTAVVMRMMEERRELHKAHGRLTLGVLIVQDLMVLGMMAAIPMLAFWSGAEGEEGPELVPILRKVATATLGITALIVLGRWALPKILRAAAGSAEVLLVLSSGIALGAAVATHQLGFSPELGAFLAGFLLASTPFRYQLSGQLAPLRDLFLAVFFTAMGLELNIQEVAGGWWLILLAFVATVAVKAGAMALAAWGGGASGPVVVFASLALAQGSEFSLVLLAQADRAGVISEREDAYAIATVLLTLVATPLLMKSARQLAPRAARLPMPPWIHRPAFREGVPASAARPSEETAPSPEPTTVIVAGFGPVGRAVADTLEKRGARVTIIELNPRTVERQRLLGRPITFGDAANIEVLERSGLPEAAAVILTMPDEEAVLRACRQIRVIRPDIFIAARVNALSRGIQAMQLGADHVVVEELATAEAMAAQVLVKLEQVRAGEDPGPKLYAFDQPPSTGVRPAPDAER